MEKRGLKSHARLIKNQPLGRENREETSGRALVSEYLPLDQPVVRVKLLLSILPKTETVAQ
jgi:hypothetical protein